MIENTKAYSRLLGFFIAFILGVISIFYFKENNIHGAISLVVLITIYAIIGGILFDKREREAHGDSVYYLGFCLTLVGLSIGLLFKEEGAENTRQLINTFGFGLAATVTGLVARIMIQNFSEQIESDQADGAKILEQSYMRFGESIAGCSRRIDTVMAEFSSNMQHTMTENSINLQRTIAEISSGMQATMTQFTQSASRTSEELNEELSKQTMQSIRQLNEVVGKSLSAITLTGQKAIENINTTGAQISERMVEAGNSVAAAGTAMNGAASAFMQGAIQIEKAAGGLDKAADVVEETSENLAKNLLLLERSSEKVRDGMSAAVEPLREMNEFHNSIILMKNASTSIHQDMQGVLTVVHSLAASAAKVQQNAGEAAKQVEKAAVAAARAAR